jgi:hypothetical protein
MKHPRIKLNLSRVCHHRLTLSSLVFLVAKEESQLDSREVFVAIWQHEEEVEREHFNIK